MRRGLVTSPECNVRTDDPYEMYGYKMAATHGAFAAIATLLLGFACVERIIGSASSMRHAHNTINAVMSLSIVALTATTIKVFACTYDTELDVRTLDALPDIDCDSSKFVAHQSVAFVLAIMYILVIPLCLLSKLANAGTNDQEFDFGSQVGKSTTAEEDRVREFEFLEAHGWFLLKYRPGAWYAEFVFLYYRITMAVFSVLLGSSRDAPLCLAGMATATAGLLAFVLYVKPFDDGSHGSAKMMTNADKMQAYALVALLIGTAIGFLCQLDPDRGETTDALVGVFMALIGVAPVVAGLLLKRRMTKDNQDTEREFDENPLHDDTNVFTKGTTVDIDTDDGMERGAVVLGPSLRGNPDELRVRFADGTVSSTPIPLIYSHCKIQRLTCNHTRYTRRQTDSLACTLATAHL